MSPPVSVGPFNPAIEAERILAAILESSDDAIIGKDLDGIIVTWNRAAERLYGYSADEAVGRSVGLLLPDDRDTEFAALLTRIREGDVLDHHQTIRRTKARCR